MAPESVPAPEKTTGAAGLLIRALASLVPPAEREELTQDLSREHGLRRARIGTIAALAWLLVQVFGSLPALLRRTWWRGLTGFEPRSSRWRSGGLGIESWIIDARYSTRRLLARPLYASLAVLTLALGVGGTAAIYSVVRALFLDPLPVAREHEIGVLWQPGDWSEAEFVHQRHDGFPGFAHVAAVRPLDATLAVPGQPLRLLQGAGASAELFDVLGVPAWLGRAFRAGDDVPGAEPVVVISHRLWKELGGSAAVIGRRLRLGGIDRTVVGVTPPGFWFPSPDIQVWSAVPLQPEDRSGNYALVGRVTPGTTLDAMDGPLGAIASSLRERFQYAPAWDKTRAPSIVPLREHLVGDVRAGVLATLWATAIILVIACVNVSALMLGQVGARLPELAVRTALGAARRRLWQQLFCEASIIGLLAGALGAVLGLVSFRLLVRSLPLGALADVASLDWRLFTAALTGSLAAAVLVALVPGWVLWRMNLHGAMGAERTAGPSVRGGRIEAALVVAQVALAVLVIAGAGLLIRTVRHLRHIDVGVRTAGVAVVDAILPLELPPQDRAPTVLAMVDHLRRLPYVEHVAAVQTMPLRGRSDTWNVSVEGKPEFDDSMTFFRVVSRDYFAAMGMRIQHGRGFETMDRADSDRVVVINQALARKFFASEDPIGRVLHTGFDDRGERIIGVVNDVAEGDLVTAPEPARYMLYEQVPLLGHWTTFVLSGVREPLLPAALDDARAAIAAAALPIAVNETTTMQRVFEKAMGPAAQLVSLVTALAGVALVLGAVGVYGMISHHVTRRMREEGIRIALGLDPARVMAQVLARGLGLVALGSVVGLCATLFVTRLAAGLLFGVTSHDPIALLGAAAVLMLTGALASLLPARRAGRSDPAQLLRQP